MGTIAREIFTSNGTFTPKAGVTRVKVIAENLNGIRAAGGGGTNVVAEPDGTTWAYGQGSVGQIGNGAAAAVSVPTLVSGGLRFTSLYSYGGGAIYGIDANGLMWSWGINVGGSLGNNNTANQSSPNAVVGSIRWSYFPSNATNFSSTSSNIAMAAIDVNQNLWMWGKNVVGQLGNNNVTDQSSPNLVVGGLKFKQVVICNQGGVSGGQTILGLTTGGALYTWGSNANGQLGTGNSTTTLCVSSPVLVVGGGTYASIYTDGTGTFGALDTSNNFWTWGSHFQGKTGQGLNTGSVSSPVMVQGGLKFTSIKGVYNQGYFGISTAQDAYCIGGLNNSGQAGTNSGATTGYSSPTLVVGGLKWSYLAAGNGNGVSVWGITTSGAAYSWGGNNAGQLGNGASGVNQSSPVQVVGGLNFSYIFDDPGAPNSGTSSGAIGIDTQGQIWMWGGNSFGQSGIGSTASTSSPVQSIPPKVYNGLYPQNVFFLDVTPGTAYTVNIQAAQAIFGTRNLGVGISQVTVEYNV